MMDHLAQANTPTRALLPALSAALIAGTMITLFSTLSRHQAPAALFVGIAHIAAGSATLSPSMQIVVGAAIHYAVSLAWAVGFAYLALSTPALLQAPLVSGICYGILVELFMDGMLVMIGAFHLPSPSDFLRDILAHTIGFGIPLAYVVSRMLTNSATSASL